MIFFFWNSVIVYSNPVSVIYLNAVQLISTCVIPLLEPFSIKLLSHISQIFFQNFINEYIYVNIYMNIYMNIHIININLKCCSCQVGSTIHPQINLIFIFLKAQVYKHVEMNMHVIHTFSIRILIHQTNALTKEGNCSKH